MKGACLDPTLSTRVLLVTMDHLSSLYHSSGSHPQPCYPVGPPAAIGFPDLKQFSLGQATVNEILCNRLTPTLDQAPGRLKIS